ncbi:MAG: biotin carboxylase N-terminal domain-containing protein [Fimbriimonadales bacterium]
MQKIEKLLVANRGEIAMRVRRTADAMGIPCVMVFTAHDEGMPHASLTESVLISDYLAADEIIGVARANGANAIHPGYGFLSENPGFARAVEKTGVIFVGPTGDAMEAVGDKSKARALATSLGVPVAEGVGPFNDPKEIAEAVRALGAPVMLKAAAGGGGKGMKKILDFEDLDEIINSSQRETKASFGDDRMIVERFINPARHIEVQIFGDGTRCIALGERECSLQRRHQKILEESPSTAVGEDLRARLFESAKKICESVGYRNAGTVEFLLGPEGHYYFLEVNARLQVEHPVTEMCTGLDLVELQLNLAQGGELPAQESIKANGHAIEARLNAEDPYNGFLPSAGKLLSYSFVISDENVRTDTGIGDAVGTNYDSLIAKIIATGPDREIATRHLKRAIEQTELIGIYTNQALLLQIIEQPFFINGETFIDTIDNWHFGRRPVPDWFATAAVSVYSEFLRPPPDPLGELANWRLR